MGSGYPDQVAGQGRAGANQPCHRGGYARIIEADRQETGCKDCCCRNAARSAGITDHSSRGVWPDAPDPPPGGAGYGANI